MRTQDLIADPRRRGWRGYDDASPAFADSGCVNPRFATRGSTPRLRRAGEARITLRTLEIFIPFALLVALAGCANSDVADDVGLQPLSRLDPEPAGSACPSGGVRVATGLDSNANGALDPDEIKSSQVVCNGANGKDGEGGGDAKGSLVNVDAEAAGTNCPAGGARIQTGADANGNGALDPDEVKTTRYVCNGAASGSSAGVVSVYDEGTVNVGSTTSVTILSATIAVPAAGKVIAVANADTYCALPAILTGHDCASSGSTFGYYTLTTASNGGADTGGYEFFALSPNATENTTRTAVFDATAAGNVTVYLRARTDGAGQFGFFRTSITLVYLP